MFDTWNFETNIRNIGNKKSSEPGADGYMMPDGACGGAVAELPVSDTVPAKPKALGVQKELKQPVSSHSSRSSLSTRNKNSPLPPPPPPSSPPPKIPEEVFTAEECVIYTKENKVIINPSYNPFKGDEDDDKPPPLPARPEAFGGTKPKIRKKPSFRKIKDLMAPSQPPIMKGSFTEIMERQRRKADGITEETIEMTAFKQNY
jgi:hypothetical protein